MKKNELIDKYFTLVMEEDLCSSPANLRFYLNYLFKKISFDKKKMLDIGSGYGICSFYAACIGADEVICLEPELAGSSQGVIEKFNKLKLGLKIGDKIKLESTTMQNFDYKGKKFDIILLNNSINHLNEESCINLKHDRHAMEIYMKIFCKLSNLASIETKLIITDCSRYNFFALLNLKNPFAPSIEWHKHQSPKHWAKLLSNVGFCNPKIRWTSFNQLRSIGRLLFGNKFASYFFHSHFCLIMEKNIWG